MYVCRAAVRFGPNQSAAAMRHTHTQALQAQTPFCVPHPLCVTTHARTPVAHAVTHGVWKLVAANHNKPNTSKLGRDGNARMAR